MQNTNRRVLTLIPASATVVSNMVGTGVFTTTGFMIAAGAGGGDVLIAWLIGGVLALCGALCYGEIGAHIPESGGEYVFLSKLVHPSLGYVSGWISMIVGFAAPIAASAMAMHLYLHTVMPWWPSRLMAVATIITISALHAFDLRLGSRFQTAFSVLKVLLIVAFIAGVLLNDAKSQGNTLAFNPAFWTSGPFAGLLVFVSFAYSGWNAATYVGAEVAQPDKTVPRALATGTILVTVLYLWLNFAYLRAVPVGNLSGATEVANVVAKTIWGDFGGAIVSSLVALTLAAPVSAMLMVGPRVSEAMARDGYLPRSFAALSSNRVPNRAVWLQAVLASFIALTSSFSALLIYIGFTLNIFAALTVLGVFRLRMSGKCQHRICVGYPVTPILFIAFCAWTTIWAIRAEPMAALAGAATVAIGFGTHALRVTTFYNFGESRE